MSCVNDEYFHYEIKDSSFIVVLRGNIARSGIPRTQKERKDPMKVRKRGAMAVLLALALILAGLPLTPAKEAEAAKKMKLSKE